MKLFWTERALVSLEAIGAFIAEDKPQAATRWLQRLIQRAESAVTIPLAGRIVPELGREDVREVFERSYRIVYQVRSDVVFILTVFEGSRLLRASDIEGLRDDA